MAIASLTDRLFDLLPPLDVGDPAAFQAATVAVFAGYPLEVIEAAVPKIACSSDRPTLKLITAVCEELYAPIGRQIERDLAARSHRLSLPPPRKRTPEEQARIDADVTAFRLTLGAVPRRVILPPSADLPIKAAVPPAVRPGYAQRVAADLALRAARRSAIAVPEEGQHA